MFDGAKMTGLLSLAAAGHVTATMLATEPTSRCCCRDNGKPLRYDGGAPSRSCRKGRAITRPTTRLISTHAGPGGHMLIGSCHWPLNAARRRPPGARRSPAVTSPCHLEIPCRRDVNALAISHECHRLTAPSPSPPGHQLPTRSRSIFHASSTSPVPPRRRAPAITSDRIARRPRLRAVEVAGLGCALRPRPSRQAGALQRMSPP